MKRRIVSSNDDDSDNGDKDSKLGLAAATGLTAVPSPPLATSDDRTDKGKTLKKPPTSSAQPVVVKQQPDTSDEDETPIR